MGLLDQVIGGLMGGGGGQQSPIAGVLMNMLGGGQQQQGYPQQQGGYAPQQGGGMGLGQMAGMAGGLAGLVGAFNQAGLGNVVQSWISNGPNHPVSPDQLQSVFGQQQVSNMASQAGMQPQDFLSQLAQHLPHAVDGMTPGGRMPEEGSMSV